MSNTLIVFASRHGTVEKCARELFRLMDGKVDICDLNKREFTPDLSTYDAIIIGGSIHSGKIQNVIADFCNENQEILEKKHLGLFINCLYSGDRAQEQLDNAYPLALNRKAIVRDYFGSEVDELKLNFWERIVTRQMINKESLVVSLSKDKIKSFAEKMSSVNEEKS